MRIVDVVKEWKNSGKIEGFEMKQDSFKEIFQMSGSNFENFSKIKNLLFPNVKEYEKLNFSFCSIPDSIDNELISDFTLVFELLDCLYKINYPTINQFNLVYSYYQKSETLVEKGVLISLNSIQQSNSYYSLLSKSDFVSLVLHLGTIVIFREKIKWFYYTNMFKSDECCDKVDNCAFINYMGYDVLIHRLENWISSARKEIDDIELNRLKKSWQNLYLGSLTR